MPLKNYLLFFAMLMVVTNFYCQVGIGTTTPSPASMLEVSSTSDEGATYGGFMPPRVPDITARDLIDPEVEDIGLMVFIQNIGCLQIWDGNNWKNGMCLNYPPVAKDVHFLGGLFVGQNLEASFNYFDAEGDAEGIHLYKWYRADDVSGTGAIAIPGATSKIYQIVSDDINKYISVEVIPVAAAGLSPGDAVKSPYQGPIGNVPQILASWDFIGKNGNEVTLPAVVATDIANGVVSRGNGINRANNIDRFNANNFTQPNLAGAITNNDYFQFTITPSVGKQITITEVFFNYERSSTGPSLGALRSSIDNYATNLATFSGLAETGDSRTIDLSGSGITNQTSIVTFRLYLYGNNNSEGSGGFEGPGNDIEIKGFVN